MRSHHENAPVKWTSPLIKVLRSGPVAGPVQGPGSGFWPGHRVWPGRPGQFLKKKNQNDVVLVKKTKKKVNGFVTGSCRVNRVDPPGQPGYTGFFLPSFFHQPGPVTPGFSFPRFFINPARFRPRGGRVPGRPAGPSRVSKLCLWWRGERRAGREAK